MVRRAWSRRALLCATPVFVWVLASCDTGPALPKLPQVSVKDAPQQVQDQIRAAHDRVGKAPRDPEANGHLGMALHAYQEYGPAAVLYERARLLEPTAFRWPYYHAFTLDQLGRRPEAIAALRRALELTPGEPWAQMKLAELLLGTDGVAESRALYEQLVSQHPDLAGGHYGFGRLDEREGNLESAVQRLEKAIEVGGSFETGHYALALIYRRLGNAAQAERHLALYQQHRETRLTTGPHMAEVQALVQSDRSHVARGLRLLRAGQYAEAVAEYEKAVQLNPQAVTAHANLINLYGKLGQIEKAEEHYREATARDPDHAPAHFNLGVIRLGAQRHEEAAEAFRRAVDTDPYYADAYLNLGIVLEQQGWTEQALAQYQRAVTHSPNYREAHYRLGLLLTARGQGEPAIEHLTKSLEAEEASTTPWRLRSLAIAYGKAGKYDLARSTLQRARKAAERAQNGELLGLIDQNLDQLARARP